MTQDRLFRDAERATVFEFNAEVAQVFDDMISRSVPFYVEQQRMIAELARTFWLPEGFVYDLGCSTGTTLINVVRALGDDARAVGYDNSQPMLDRAATEIARAGLGDRIELRHADLNQDLLRLPLSGARVVVMAWTFQFVRPLRRDHLVRRIHEALPAGGALIVTDKVLANSGTMSGVFIDLFHDLKRRNRYSEVEIARKREALENVLIPYRIDEHVDLYRSCGFEIVETFFQWYNFAGFLCVKQNR